MKFAVIAGETSGDALGAALISALRTLHPHAQFVGVTGPKMRSAGCESLGNIEQLSVMGLVEIVPRLPGILRLRRALVEHLLALSPTAVIAIDAPDFNLPLEYRLRRSGLRTVHVVSPSVWAWRSGRVKTIVQSVNLMLCLFPFETQFYLRHEKPGRFTAKYIGHPLADFLSPQSKEAARISLGLPQDNPVVAILPGSRMAELKRLAKPFVKTAGRLAQYTEDIHFIVPFAKPELRPSFEDAINRFCAGTSWHLINNNSHAVISAADAVLVASGTATLECLLLGRPMVVGYRVSPVTALLLRAFGLHETKKFSLPNLLSGKSVVPEFIQRNMTSERLSEAMWTLLRDPNARQDQTDEFSLIRDGLRQDAAKKAAAEISTLCSA